MKLVPLLLIFGGLIIVYAARYDKDPRNVIFESLGFKQRVANPVGIGGKTTGQLKNNGVKGASEETPSTTPGVKVTSV